MLLISFILCLLAAAAAADKSFQVSVVNPKTPYHGKQLTTLNNAIYIDGPGEEISLLLKDNGSLFDSKNNHTINVDVHGYFVETKWGLNTKFGFDSDNYLTYDGEDFLACPSQDKKTFRLAYDCLNGTSVSLRVADQNDFWSKTN